MIEIVDPLRTRIMRSVRQRDTAPEMALRRGLHAEGYRFRVNVRALPGSPDIVLAGRRKVIFVHGCFWHRHLDCRLATFPKSRVEFWSAKFAANVDRDAKNVRELQKLGWDPITIWQCEIEQLQDTIARLRQLLGPPGR